jgi:alpha-D-xyloside xylohydrolase
MGVVPYFLISMLALPGRASEGRPTAITSAHLDGNRARFAVELSDGKPATCEISMVSPHGYRIQLSRSPVPSVANSDLALETIPVALLPTDSGWSVGADDIRVEVGKKPFSLSWRDAQGQIRLALGADGMPPLQISKGTSPASERIRVSFPVAANARFFGLGATTGRLEKRGLRFDFPNGAAGGSEILFSTEGWGIHLMGNQPASWDIAAQTPHALSIEQSGALDLVVFLAPDLATLVSQHTKTFHRASQWPKPFGGAWINFDEQTDTAAVRRAIEQLRAHQVPYDVVNLGRSWWITTANAGQSVGCDFAWNETRYPAPKALASELAALGISMALEVSPLLPDGKGPTIEATKRGLVLRDARGVIRLPGTTRGTLLDLRKPEASRVWAEGLALLRRDGVEAFVAVDVSRLPAHVGTEASGNLRAQFAAAINQSAGPTPIWIRTGDEAVIRRAPDIAAALRANLSAGISGNIRPSIVIEGDADDTVFEAATILGLLSPVVQIGPAKTLLRMLDKTDERIGDVMRFRYTLQPMFWAAERQIRENGLPVLRHLGLVITDDPTVWGIDDQYFLGGDLMIAPVLSPGDPGRQVYLPRGRWYEIDNVAQRHDGPGHVQFSAPAGYVALVREGAVLPRLSEKTRHLKGGPSAPLRIDVYPARIEAGASLERKLQFEDDGIAVNAQVIHTQQTIEIRLDPVPIPVAIRFMQQYPHALLTEQRSGKQLLISGDGTVIANAGRGVHLRLQR